MASFAGVVADGGGAKVEGGFDGVDKRGFTDAAVTGQNGDLVGEEVLQLVKAQ